MHLLAAKPGSISDGSAALDLGQAPGDIVFLSSADSELACLAAAQDRLGSDAPSLRLANLLQLGHNLSVDLYLDKVVRHARLVILRLLGGARYWPYGIEQLAALCRESGIAFAALPGDDQPDAELMELSTVSGETTNRLWRYCIEGGIENASHLLRFAATLTGREGRVARADALAARRPLLARRSSWRAMRISPAAGSRIAPSPPSSSTGRCSRPGICPSSMR